VSNIVLISPHTTEKIIPAKIPIKVLKETLGVLLAVGLLALSKILT